MSIEIMIPLEVALHRRDVPARYVANHTLVVCVYASRAYGQTLVPYLITPYREERGDGAAFWLISDAVHARIIPDMFTLDMLRQLVNDIHPDTDVPNAHVIDQRQTAVREICRYARLTHAGGEKPLIGKPYPNQPFELWLEGVGRPVYRGRVIKTGQPRWSDFSDLSDFDE